MPDLRHSDRLDCITGPIGRRAGPAPVIVFSLGLNPAPLSYLDRSARHVKTAVHGAGACGFMTGLIESPA